MNTDPATYVRGTKTTRKTTARLVRGDRILTAGNGLTNFHSPSSKTGSIIRTVARLQSYQEAGGFHRASRRYVVEFADGTQSANCAPIQTWAVVTPEA
jgi:hypothetical protein